MTQALDNVDSQIDFTYNSLSQVESEAQTIDSGTTRTVTHAYNEDGTRSQTAYPDGRTIDFTYNDIDLVTTVEDATSDIVNYAYIGRRYEQKILGNNASQLDLVWNDGESDNLGVGRIAGTTHMKITGGNVIDSRTYTWDADKNKTQRADTRASGPQLTHDYTYDGRNRMTDSDDGTTQIDYDPDPAGNFQITGYELTGPDAALNNYTETPTQTRAYDLQGNFASWDGRAEWYTFDAHDRLISHVTAGSRTIDTVTVGGNYVADGGTWSVTDDVLTETSGNTARILRDFATSNTEFGFTYKSPHATDDANYDPEQYALSILRLVDGATYSYVALVIEPDRMSIREWEDNVMLSELASQPIASEQDTWYDVKVEYGGTNGTTLDISHAKSGAPLEEVFSDITVTLEEDASQKIGFGVGSFIATPNGDYEFKNIIFRDDLDSTETTEVTYAYDALGRRIQKVIDPSGSPTTINYYYDGAHVIEERDGANTVVATYVYGPMTDEVLTMSRDTEGDPTFENFYYHTDDLGNVMAITDATGDVAERYAYGDYGAVSIFDGTGSGIGSTAIGNDYLFNGRRCDPETGLYYYRTRYMDPSAGRFITRDTIGLWGDANNLGNGQVYVGNNPWTRVDPYGQQQDDIMDLIEGENIRNNALVRGQMIDNPQYQALSSSAKAIDAGAESGANALANEGSLGFVGESAFEQTEYLSTNEKAAMYGTYFGASALAFGKQVLGGIARGGIAAYRGVIGVFKRGADDAVEAAVAGRNITKLLVKEGDLAYGPSARGQLRSFADGIGANTLTDVVQGPVDDWVMESVRQIDAAASRGNTVHFDLTNVSDIDNVLAGTGEFADSVTGHELRYIRDNWERLQDNVQFYQDAVVRTAPWK